MARIEIYTKSWCPYCVRAKALLERKQLAFDEIDIEREPARREEMIARTQGFTVPQILLNGRPLGGCDDLYALEASGQLDALLAE